MSMAYHLAKHELVEQEIVNNPAFSGQPKSIINNPEVYIGICMNNEIGQEVVIKVPLLDKAKKFCENEYALKRKVGNQKHLHQLFGVEPFRLGSFYAVLGKYAKGSAGDENFIKGMSEERATNYIHQASKGLSEIHRVGWTHRDIKPSNILIYSEDWAVLSDFGVVSAQPVTQSAYNQEMFMSPELLTLKNSRGFTYDAQEDIYQVGATFFMLATGGKPLGNLLKERVPFDENNTLGEIISQYYPVINSIIEEQALKFDTKRRLKRFLGPKNKGKIPAGKTLEDFRYQSIDAAISDFEGKRGVIEIRENHPDIETYLSYVQDFHSAVKKIPDSRTGRWGTVSYECIDELVRSKNKVLSLQSKPVIQAKPSLSKKVQPLHDRFSIEQEKDFDILKSEIRSIRSDPTEFRSKTQKEQIREFWGPMYEISHLWGPPFTETEKISKEKDTYSLAEIKRKATHFHKKPPWL